MTEQRVDTVALRQQVVLRQPLSFHQAIALCDEVDRLALLVDPPRVCEECGNDDATVRLSLCPECLHRLDT